MFGTGTIHDHNSAIQLDSGAVGHDTGADEQLEGAFLHQRSAIRAMLGAEQRERAAIVRDGAAHHEETMPSGAHRGSRVLLFEAQRTLLFNQTRLGAAIGASKRTVQRLSVGKAPLYTHYLTALIPAVYAQDAALAAEMAAAIGQTLESLGVRPAAPPPGPPPPPPMPRDLAADAVVCVAAEGMGLTPAAVRGALVAAFKRARELGLSFEEVERALGGTGEAGGAATAKKGKAAV